MEVFETESQISPDVTVDDTSDNFEEFETLTNDPLLFQDPITQPADGGEVLTSPPDAINFNDESNAAEPVSQDSESGEGGEAPELTTEAAANGSDGLQKIYSLLDERLPAKNMQEAESETDNLESEPEVTISDLYNEINSIREFESEQLDELRTIRDNNIISNNNNYHLGIYSLSIICAIWGTVCISLLFRKIF